MADKDYFLILDAGSGAGRALLFDTKGYMLAEHYAEWSYEPDNGIPDAVLFNPDEFMRILIDTARHAVEKSGVHPGQIIGVSSTSLREGVVFLDKEGRELYCGPQFDGRASTEGKALEESIGQSIYQQTGTYPPAYGYMARLLWFKNHKPQIFKKIAVVLEMGGWITYRLTGKYFAEATLACSSGAFSIADKKWAYDIIDAAGCSRDLFPEIRPAGSLAGSVKQAIAEEIGLQAGTPVFIGGGDSQCAMLGMGCISGGDTGIIAGTTSPVMQILDQAVVDPEIRTWSNVSLKDDQWILESSSIVTGMAYRWVRDCMFPDSDYADMDRLLENTEPGSKGVMAFLGSEIMDIKNYVGQWQGGFVFPVPNSDIAREDFARATIESNAYAARGNIEQIESISKKQANPICFCGGQTASDHVLRIISVVLNRPIKVFHGQRTALGAAMLAAKGTGVYDSLDQSVENMLGDSVIVKPAQNLAKVYEPLYRQWCEQFQKVKTNKELLNA